MTAATRHAALARTLASTRERQQMVNELNERMDGEARKSHARIREARREEARSALSSDRPAQAESIYQQLLLDSDKPALTPSERNLFEHGLGLSLLRQGRHEEAAQHFARAATLDPDDGDSVFMQGLAAYRAGDLREARRLFRQALHRGVDEETAASARGYLDRLSFGGRRGGEGFSAGLSAGTGYDNNVIQASASRPESTTADQAGDAGAFFASAAANLGYDLLVGWTGFVSADYDFEQLAFLDKDHDNYGLQDHNVRLRGEWSPSSMVHLGLLAGEELQFSGLSGFRCFQNVLTAEPSILFDELPYTSTNLRVRLQKKNAIDPAYPYYSGSRLDVRLGQRLRWRSVRGELAYRHRRERIGTRTETLLELGTQQTSKFRKRKTTDPSDQASYVYAAPYSYNSNAVLASMEITVGVFRWGVDASAEILSFIGDNKVNFVAPAMNINRLQQKQHRRDIRLSGSLSLAAKLGDHLELVARYDVIDNRSTLAVDVDNRNYVKHVVALTLEADW